MQGRLNTPTAPNARRDESASVLASILALGCAVKAVLQTCQHRALLALTVVLATLFAQVSQAATPATMATITGVVGAPKSFVAAQVYLRNVDKRLQYMVFTNRGQFDAVWLFPGNYEVWAEAPGLKSEVQKLSIAAGTMPPLKFVMAELPPQDKFWSALRCCGSNLSVTAPLFPYETLYPPGPGRQIAERTCIVCHGENWLSAKPANEQTWTARIHNMTGKDLFDRPVQEYAEGALAFRVPYARLDQDDVKILAKYLADNFGPDKEPRLVKPEQTMALDEGKLSKAMYIEYYVPPDTNGYGTSDPKNHEGAWGPYRRRRTLQDTHFDSEGNVWATDRSVPVRLVKLDPRTATWKEWALPNPKHDIHELIIGRDGMIWLPEHANGPKERNHLIGFNPKTEKFEHIIDMDPDDLVRGPKWSDSLSIDSRDNIYVSWIMGGALTRFDGQTKKVTDVFMLPTAPAVPYGQVIDSKDNIFIAMWAKGSLMKFDTRKKQWTELTPPTFPNEVRRLRVDNKDNVWMGIFSPGHNRPGVLAKYDQKADLWTEYAVPVQRSQPYDVYPDIEGGVWFADSPTPGRPALFAYMDANQAFTFYPKPQATADVAKIQLTGEGAVWGAPRGSLTAPGMTVLYPDKSKIKDLGAFFRKGTFGGYAFK